MVIGEEAGREGASAVRCCSCRCGNCDDNSGSTDNNRNCCNSSTTWRSLICSICCGSVSAEVERYAQYLTSFEVEANLYNSVNSLHSHSLVLALIKRVLT